MTRPTTEELARRALESVARAHGVSVADVHAAVRGAAEHTKALGALAPEELRCARRSQRWRAHSAGERIRPRPPGHTSRKTQERKKQVTRPTTEELARRALESVARAHGVSVADVHAAVRGAAEHTRALGALAPEELVAYLAHKSRNREP